MLAEINPSRLFLLDAIEVGMSFLSKTTIFALGPGFLCDFRPPLGELKSRTVHLVTLAALTIVITSTSYFEYQGYGTTWANWGTLTVTNGTIPPDGLIQNVANASVVPSDRSVRITGNDTIEGAMALVSGKSPQYVTGRNVSFPIEAEWNDSTHYIVANPTNRTVSFTASVLYDGRPLRVAQSIWAFPMVMMPLVASTAVLVNFRKPLFRSHTIAEFVIFGFLSVYLLLELDEMIGFSFSGLNQSLLGFYLLPLDFIPVWIVPTAPAQLFLTFDFGLAAALLTAILVVFAPWLTSRLEAVINPSTISERMWFYLAYAGLLSIPLLNLIYYPPSDVVALAPGIGGSLASIIPKTASSPLGEYPPVVVTLESIAVAAAISLRVVCLRRRFSHKARSNIARIILALALLSGVAFCFGVVSSWPSSFGGFSTGVALSSQLVISAIILGLLDHALTRQHLMSLPPPAS